MPNAAAAACIAGRFDRGRRAHSLALGHRATRRRSRRPDVEAAAPLAREHEQHAATYAAQRCRRRANIRRASVIADRHTAWRQRLERDACSGGRPRLTISSTRAIDRAAPRPRSPRRSAAAARASRSSRRCRPSRRAVPARARLTSGAPGSNSARAARSSLDERVDLSPAALASDRCRHPASRAQRLLQQRLDLRADRARWRSPTHATSASTSSGASSGRAARIGHDHAALLGDQRGADVVRMTASAGGSPRSASSRPSSGRRSAMKRSWPAISSYSCPPVEAY